MTSLNIGANRDSNVTMLKARERALRYVYTSVLPQEFRIDFAPEDDAPS